MLPLTFVYNSAGDLVLGNRWLGWIGGGVMVVLFFLLPYWIERYDLFSLRQYFTHDEPPSSFSKENEIADSAEGSDIRRSDRDQSGTRSPHR